MCPRLGMLVSDLEKVPFVQYFIKTFHRLFYTAVKMANKGGILKSIKLCVIKMKKEDPTQPTITYAASVFYYSSRVGSRSIERNIHIVLHGWFSVIVVLAQSQSSSYFDVLASIF